MPKETDILIISDLHLGSDAVIAKEIEMLLKTLSFKRLIILGDLFDHSDITHLKKSEWELLSEIGRIAERGIGTTWIKGNHDRHFPHTIPELKKVKILEEEIVTIGNKKHILLHGDQFDMNVQKNTLPKKVGEKFNTFLLKYRLKNKLVMGTIGRLYGLGMRMSSIVANGAIKHALQKNGEIIICGHTHRPMIRKKTVNGKEITYINTGSWTLSVGTYVTIDETHGARLHKHNKNAVT